LFSSKAVGSRCVVLVLLDGQSDLFSPLVESSFWSLVLLGDDGSAFPTIVGDDDGSLARFDLLKI
jgi:hypothetical protein